MYTIGIPYDVIQLLGDNGGTSNFRAELYQDYEAGQDQYILAFQGTENLEHWIVNFKQAIGLPTDYYDTAMLIGDRLRQVQQLQGHLTITGHSLGGGLATRLRLSAAFRLTRLMPPG